MMRDTAIPTLPRGGNHTPAFAEAAAGERAHEATMTVIKGLAMTGFRVVADTDFFTEASRLFPLFEKSEIEPDCRLSVLLLLGERSF